MYRGVIIDDQEMSRLYLLNAIKENSSDVEVVGMATNVMDGVRMIRELKPDVLFLDVELESGTGFEVLEQIESDGVEVIFTTGHEHYALKALKASALDYLHKPIDGDELKIALNKMRKRCEDRAVVKENSVDDQAKISIPVNDGVKVVNISSITRCESDHYYTKIFVKDGTRYVVSKTLKEFEDLLTEHSFVRIHQSHLISLRFLAEFQKEGKSNFVLLTDGAKLPVSRRKKEVLMERLKAGSY